MAVEVPAAKAVGADVKPVRSHASVSDESGADVAKGFVEDGPERREIDPVAERKLLWKIDCLLMPLLTISFGLQYYDKAIFSSASVFGLLEDMDLSVVHPGPPRTVSLERFSTANSAFYWGYLVACYPMSYILQRFPLGRTLSLFILVWGVITLLTLACHTYPGIVVQRVFLGVIESAVSPGFVLLSGMWYRKSEQPVRLGIWYSATGLFSIFSGAVNYGIGRAATSSGSIHPWKAMYLFAGLWTVVWAFIVYFCLPDNPMSATRFFTLEERKLAVERLRENQTGMEAKKFKKAHLFEAFADPQLYVFFLMAIAIYVCNAGVTTFGAQIVKSFGYSSLKTILMLTPAGGTTVVSIYVSCWVAGHWKNLRTILIPITCFPVIAGAVMIWKGSWQYRGLPLTGYALLGIFGAPYVLLLSLSTANVAGHTKKAFSAATLFVGYNVANIFGPYLVDTTTKAEHYPTTWISILVCMVFTCVASILLRVYYSYENAKRDRAQAALDAEKRDAAGAEHVAFGDLTDRENIYFRYSL